MSTLPRIDDWRELVTLPEGAVLLTLLALLWGLGGLAGVLGWTVVAAIFIAAPPIVTVAVGQLALITLGDTAPLAGVAAVQASFVALLLLDGASLGWTWRTSLGFVGLTGLLSGTVLLLADRTPLLIASVFLAGVFAAGVIGVSELTHPSRSGVIFRGSE